MTVRVHKLAKELGMKSNELLAKLKVLKVKAKSHMSVLDEETAELVKAELLKPEKPKPPKKASVKVAPKPRRAPKPAVERVEEKILVVKFPLTVKELSLKLDLKPSALIKRLMDKKVFATINQPLKEDVVRDVAAELGYRIQQPPTAEEQLLSIHKRKDKPKELVPRWPVVTLMGHVDHGKTSLLDFIRKAKVADKEAGGITQHIGAYEVSHRRGTITFLDTPGHEAFTAIRMRGANATDIVVLVVAANDGVMPQTQEAIDHARAAKVPIVVAINKCDLPHISIDKVKHQLAKYDLLAEDMGGKTITVNVSAKTGQGIDELLEMISLEAELLELKVNPKRLASGVVIESKLSPGRGPVATVLVRKGTLHTGDLVLCGSNYGRIKAIRDENGKTLNAAPPAKATEIIGLSGVPPPGEIFYAVDNEKQARDISQKRQEAEKLRQMTAVQRLTLEDLSRQIKEGSVKELNLVIKADVQGSLEALIGSLEKIGSSEVAIKIIHKGVGNINVSDVMLAAVSHSVIVGFYVGVEMEAAKSAKKQNVDVRLYDIIYKVTQDIKGALEGMLKPEIKEIFLGRAQIRQVFKISRVGVVAGSYVIAGRVLRGARCRIIRDNEVIFESRISSLKRFKEDTKEVAKGFECGIGIGGFKDLKPTDLIEAFEEEEISRKL